MGDSAGGGMSLALAQMLKAEGAPMPGSLVLYSPWVDATATAEGQRAIEARDRMLAVSGLEACGEMYRGELAVDDPRVSPLFGDLQGLPPMAIFSGTSDILLVDGRRLAQRLENDGMPDHIYREYEDMFHVWMLLPVPEAMQARSETVDFIRKHRSAA
jgi:acetyl esterase/lipase